MIDVMRQAEPDVVEVQSIDLAQWQTLPPPPHTKSHPRCPIARRSEGLVATPPLEFIS